MRSRAAAASILLAFGSVSVPATALAQAQEARAAKPAAEASGEPDRPRAEREPATSVEVARITSWVMSTRDNGDLPFIVIDKTGAEVFVFDPEGRLMGKSAALLGSTTGDESSPGVGDRELSEISPEERTTPAGRFVANFGWARGRERVLWVDYATAISLHPVVTGNRKEQRLKRLKSATAEDNRITYGCINVPQRFYSKVVQPLLKNRTGIVYILPDTKPLTEVFLAFRGQAQAASLSSASAPSS